MPRHRKESIARHRAQPADDKSGRRARFSVANDGAAIDGAANDRAANDRAANDGAANDGAATDTAATGGAAFDSAAIGGPAVGEAPTAATAAQDSASDGVGQHTAPLAAAPARFRPRRRRTRRSRHPGLGLPRVPRVHIWPTSSDPGRQRWLRGLLVTPWFAAGAGFVIAAGLALNSPHTMLTYRPNTQPCEHSCERPLPSGGSAAVVTPGVRIKPAKPAKPAHHRRRHAGPPHRSPAGALVRFKIIWHQSGRFGAFVTIPARQARHAWSLRFDIPGAKIIQVWGAAREPTDGHGVLVRTAAHPPGPPGGEGGDGGDGHGQGGWQRPNGVSPGVVTSGRRWDVEHGGGFIVIAEGTPAIPTECILNGHACHFG